mmetsp:Transcript_12654/g.34906  ORF Transcript_12654/g.34906 Transcript_12654/m.34906 type:complete len:314 (+) Transcript_12654:506-1447(+)
MRSGAAAVRIRLRGRLHGLVLRGWRVRRLALGVVLVVACVMVVVALVVSMSLLMSLMVLLRWCMRWDHCWSRCWCVMRWGMLVMGCWGMAVRMRMFMRVRVRALLLRRRWASRVLLRWLLLHHWLMCADLVGAVAVAALAGMVSMCMGMWVCLLRWCLMVMLLRMRMRWWLMGPWCRDRCLLRWSLLLHLRSRWRCGGGRLRHVHAVVLPILGGERLEDAAELLVSERRCCRKSCGELGGRGGGLVCGSRCVRDASRRDAHGWTAGPGAAAGGHVWWDGGGRVGGWRWRRAELGEVVCRVAAEVLLGVVVGRV